MKRPLTLLTLLSLLSTAILGKLDIPVAPSPPSTPVPRQPDGNATTTLTGELKQWHKVTLTLDGQFAAESDGLREKSFVSPFTDLALNVTFTHESGAPSYKVPGYFAADGDAANTSADSGTKWRAHLSPDKTGTWSYTTSFTSGKNAALVDGGMPLAPFDGVKGSFTITESDKTGRDFRSQGRLQYVGKHHLQFAGSKQFFLKAGPDAPETLLGKIRDTHEKFETPTKIRSIASASSCRRANLSDRCAITPLMVRRRSADRLAYGGPSNLHFIQEKRSWGRPTGRRQVAAVQRVPPRGARPVGTGSLPRLI